MTLAIEAIFESGVLKPLEPLDLPEHQVVSLTIYVAPPTNLEDELEAWHQVYAGFAGQEIEEIESIILDRSHFMSQANG